MSCLLTNKERHEAIIRATYCNNVNGNFKGAGEISKLIYFGNMLLSLALVRKVYNIG